MLKIHFFNVLYFLCIFFNPAVMGCIIYLLCLLYLSNFKQRRLWSSKKTTVC